MTNPTPAASGAAPADRLKAAIDAIAPRFESANPIPVQKATVPVEEWTELLAALNAVIVALASPQVAPAQRNTMRAFEAWYCSDGNYEPEELDKLVGGACCANADTENMWQVWQDALIRLAAPVQVAPQGQNPKLTMSEWVKHAKKHLMRFDLDSPADGVGQAAPQDDARDAARYRWLRRQCWDRASLFVVSGGKESVRLGTYCPTAGRLDELVDASINSDAK